MVFFDKILDFLELLFDDYIDRKHYWGFTLSDSDINLNEIVKGNPRNFKYLDALVHSGAKEIIIDSDIILDDYEESLYLDGIRLNVDNLTIDGNGHEINAKEKTRIFTIYGKNIVFKNLYFKNGYTEERGGALYVSRKSELKIINCCFENNFNFHKGGAIHLEGKLDVSKSRFENNSAKDFGGAISADRGFLNICSSEFISNSVDGYGGGISNFCNLNITDSIFENNVSNNGSAAINCFLSKEVNISNTKFINNRSRSTIIESSSSCILKLENCYFEDNKPEYKN